MNGLKRILKRKCRIKNFFPIEIFLGHSRFFPKIQTTVRPSVGTNGNLENTDTIQIKMGALVNQSHAKKLFGARGR